MPSEVVYEDEDILVIFDRDENIDCFVTFTGVGDHKRKGFGQDFIKKNRYSGLFFVSKWNHWYQTQSMPEALTRAVAVLDRHSFKTIIGYGSSMGGYGVISNSSSLKLARAILVAPQFSIDAAKVPFEKRWRAEANKLVFSRDDMASQINKSTKKSILFDPVSIDRLHADLFAQFPNTELVSIPMGGHVPARVLQDIGLLQTTIMGLANDSFDRKAFLARLHADRRKSKTYWHALYEAASPRRPNVALYAAERSLALAPAEPVMLLHRANLLTRVRRFEDALVAAEAVVAAVPQHPAAWRALSTANRYLNRAAESVSAARKAVELRPKDADLWRLLLDAVMLAQDYDEAVRVGTEAISLAPHYAHTYLRTAQALHEQGKLRAIEMLAKAVALAPANQSWATMLADWRNDLAEKPTLSPT
ncbi:hypothetical protein [Acidisphaera sp. L21]|uniref:hypothetical protein n=1 Tax=Acidisphaera sp. L21 TaxID=1641851 RepID=UPI00131E8317|nr:hypothetical protein [Acidisphaera sp. L21]